MTTTNTQTRDLRPSLSLRQAEPRATPPSTGQRFRDALAQGTSALAQLVPGGQSLVAVARSSTSGPSASAPAGGGALEGLGLGGSGGTGTAASQGLVDAAQDQSMQLLALQQQMNLENRQFTTVSNVMRARHDTAKSVIGNVRG